MIVSHQVFLVCSLEECEKRDPKGLYKRARIGEIKNFTGISAPYEEPMSPEILIETDKITVEEAADQIYQYLKEKRVI